MTASESQLVPVARMRERLRRSREDSDATYFFDVVAAGELVLKLTVTGLTASLRRDPDGHQYRIESALVRGNGLGDWVSALDELLIWTARLDAEEAEAKASTQVVEPAEALAWLRDLPALWSAADDSGRRLLTEALFEKVEVLGVQSVTIHPTPEADAHGWSDAFGPVPLLLNAGRAFSTDGRGERSSTNTLRVKVRITSPRRTTWQAAVS